MQCGNQFTSSLEGMLSDIILAKDTQSAFDSHLKEQLSAAEVAGTPIIAFSALVLTTGFWPKQRSRHVVYPLAMQTLKVSYSHLYGIIF